MRGLTIVGSGHYVPGPAVSNARLARVMDTNDDWIRQRTGIEQRHYAPEGVGAAELALPASRDAIARAGLKPSDVDYILLGTMTPDYLFPGSAALLGARLGIAGVPALDIRQQCAAMIFGLQLAQGLFAAGQAKTILLVGAEAHAGFMPWTSWDVLYGDDDRRVGDEEYALATRHRGLAVLFGDGAGALVLRPSEVEDHGLVGVEIHSDGNDAEELYLPCGFGERPFVSRETIDEERYIPRMNGRALFRNAVNKLPEVVRHLCDRHGVRPDDVDLYIAHQANDRINEAVRKALGQPPEKVPSNIARYGNTSAATIPILVDELLREGRIRPGQLLCFLALGTGLHWGAALLRV